MRQFACGAATVFAVVMLVAMALASGAEAATLTIRITQEGEAVANQPSVFTATVTGADNGRPAFGVNVTFFVKDSFGKVIGNAEIGHGLTDAHGVVSVTYELREPGPREISVEATAKDGSAGKATTTVTVGGSPVQAYVQKAGVQIPGLNSWLIIALLSTVWGILLWVAVTVIRIAGAGDDDENTAQAPGASASRGGAIGGR
jgi:hypothetical protein